MAVVVVDAQPLIFCTETSILLFFNILLFIGVTAGIWANATRAGYIGAFLVGTVTAGAVAIVGQLISAFARPLWVRLIVALLFAGPAAVAGYAATHGIAKHLMPSEGWPMAFSIVGTIAVHHGTVSDGRGGRPSRE